MMSTRALVERQSMLGSEPVYEVLDARFTVDADRSPPPNALELIGIFSPQKCNIYWQSGEPKLGSSEAR